MANPRIDDLRKRLDREPGSRLFAQLAEELRKDGELAEAIRVARTGLAAHPNYPSARMTLGRALFDSGELAAARGELEHVLRGAPDNILASRMLAECLEGLGDLGAALLQFRAALRLAPGDRQGEVQIKALEQRLAASGGARPGPVPAPLNPVALQAAATLPPRPLAMASPPSAPGPARPMASAFPPPLAARPSPPPDLAADFDDSFEAAPSWQRQPAASAGPEAEAVLLLEDEAPTLPASPPVALVPDATVFTAAAPAAPALPAPSEAAVASLYAAPSAAAPVGETTAAFAAFSVALPPPEPVPDLPAPHPVAPEVVEELRPAPVAAASPEPHPAGHAETPALSTSTLAELYFDQGFPDKAVQVYEELLEREPQNERARARLIEIKAGSRPQAEAALPDPRAERRRGLERKIARLEGMLAAVRRG